MTWGRRLAGSLKGMFLLGLLMALFLPAEAGAPGDDRADGAAGNPAEESLSSGPTRDAYRDAVLRVKEEYHFPGVVAGVWVPGKKPWKIAEGYGDVANATPIGLNDHIPIRSITKSYTVTLLLHLVRNKVISLDDPIETFLPDLEIPNGSEITLAHLAAMESGVKSYSDAEGFIPALLQNPERQWAPGELAQFGIDESPIFDPATQYDYSNTNCILLGMVLKKVTQKPIADLYWKWIFKPLGLKNTSYPDSTDIPTPTPTPYAVNAETGAQEVDPIVNLSAFGASGGMVTTLDELHTWGKALGKGTLVGPRLQKLRMQHSRPATDGPEYDRYGLGIGELKGWWGHTGDGLGYQAATFYDPKTGAVISVILNSSQRVNAAIEVFKALAEVVHPPGAAEDGTGP